MARDEDMEPSNKKAANASWSLEDIRWIQEGTDETVRREPGRLCSLMKRNQEVQARQAGMTLLDLRKAEGTVDQYSSEDEERVVYTIGIDPTKPDADGGSLYQITGTHREVKPREGGRMFGIHVEGPQIQLAGIRMTEAELGGLKKELLELGWPVDRLDIRYNKETGLSRSVEVTFEKGKAVITAMRILLGDERLKVKKLKCDHYGSIALCYPTILPVTEATTGFASQLREQYGCVIRGVGGLSEAQVRSALAVHTKGRLEGDKEWRAFEYTVVTKHAGRGADREEKEGWSSAYLTLTSIDSIKRLMAESDEGRLNKEDGTVVKVVPNPKNEGLIAHLQYKGAEEAAARRDAWEEHELEARLNFVQSSDPEEIAEQVLEVVRRVEEEQGLVLQTYQEAPAEKAEVLANGKAMIWRFPNGGQAVKVRLADANKYAGFVNLAEERRIRDLNDQANGQGMRHSCRPRKTIVLYFEGGTCTLFPTARGRAAYAKKMTPAEGEGGAEGRMGERALKQMEERQQQVIWKGLQQVERQVEKACKTATSGMSRAQEDVLMEAKRIAAETKSMVAAVQQSQALQGEEMRGAFRTQLSATQEVGTKVEAVKETVEGNAQLLAQATNASNALAGILGRMEDREKGQTPQPNQPSQPSQQGWNPWGPSPHFYQGYQPTPRP
mmetsp:Transcript_33976/g.74333  ORF Transcript_33976/g.74333 Transcript_33976/m.74333 type:complete len:669 (-) Transcript_33976:520-2526(-)